MAKESREFVISVSDHVSAEAMAHGKTVACNYFASRSRFVGAQVGNVVLSEGKLADLLALTYEAGAKAGRER